MPNDLSNDTAPPPNENPSRRQLMAMCAGVAAAFGPGFGWSPVAFAATPPSKPTGRVVIGISKEPSVFHPLKLHVEADAAIFYNLYSSLWRVDPNGQWEPDLAAEVPTVENGGISADGLQWRVKLKENVRWHDGRPFSAEDVKFTLDLIRNLKFAAGRRSGHDLVADVNVVSPSEITWRMERAFAPYRAILAWTFIVPSHILQSAEDPNNTPRFNERPIGTGPFKWVERIPGDHITLATNTSYHGSGPYLEEIVFKYIPDVSVLYTQFQTGTIDYTASPGISPEYYASAKKLPARTVVPVSQPFVESIALNTERSVFRDPVVRNALYLGIDKVGIVEQIYYGLPKPANSFMPPESWAFNPNLPEHEYNPAKARELLDTAGWRRGADGVRSKDGLRLEFTNSTNAGNQQREQTQQYLQQTWSDLGAKVTINNLPPAAMWGDYWFMSKFDSVVVGIGYMTASDPDVTEYFATRSIRAKGGSGRNTTQFSNAEVDKLLVEGATKLTNEERRPIYQEIQKIVRNELPYLPMFQYTIAQGLKGSLSGFSPSVNVQENCWNAATWYWAS